MKVFHDHRPRYELKRVLIKCVFITSGSCSGQTFNKRYFLRSIETDCFVSFFGSRGESLILSQLRRSYQGPLRTIDIRY